MFTPHNQIIGRDLSIYDIVCKMFSIAFNLSMRRALLENFYRTLNTNDSIQSTNISCPYYAKCIKLYIKPTVVKYPPTIIYFSNTGAAFPAFSAARLASFWSLSERICLMTRNRRMNINSTLKGGLVVKL